MKHKDMFLKFKNKMVKLKSKTAYYENNI